MSSAGLSFLYHGVINHTTGSGSASTFQLWFERAGFQLQAKTIWSPIFILGETTCDLKHNANCYSSSRSSVAPDRISFKEKLPVLNC